MVRLLLLILKGGLELLEEQLLEPQLRVQRQKQQQQE